jgi:type VI secretion system protein
MKLTISDCYGSIHFVLQPVYNCRNRRHPQEVNTVKIILTTLAFRSIAPARPTVAEAINDELTIGRSPDNDFILEDPERYCSRYHARCYLLSGNYYIEDSSSSGTLVNETQRLERGLRHQLQDGDTLIIGENQLRVSLMAEPGNSPTIATAKAAPTSAFSIDDFFQPQQSPGNIEAAIAGSEPAGRIFATTSAPQIPTCQVNDFFHTTGLSEPDAVPEFDFSDLADLHDDSLPPLSLSKPLSTEDAMSTLPAQPELSAPQEPSADQEPLANQGPLVRPLATGDAQSTPSAETASEPALQPASAADSALIDSQAVRAFLRGLDLDPEDLIGLDKVEIMQSAGQMLNTLTGGLIDILRARTEVKKEFSMDVTRIQASRNNPLKFCTSTEQALLKLLTKDPAYLDAVESVDEGVADAKAHQIAIMAGMQAALEALLQRFDPAMLEQQLDGRFLLSKKARYWELYTRAFQQLVGEAEENFQALFAEAFASTYQHQINQVQNSR